MIVTFLLNLCRDFFKWENSSAVIIRDGSLVFLSSRRLKDETGGTETARIYWFLFFDSIIRTHGAPGLFFRTFITIHCQNKGSLVTVMSVSLLVFVEAVVEAYVTVTVTAVPPPPRCASQARPPRRCCKYNFLSMNISKHRFSLSRNHGSFVD